MNKEDILSEIKKIMTENFEIEPTSIRLDAHLYEDLDLDSIDAVDMVVAMQALTGKKIKPEEFKAVRTIADVVAATERLLAKESLTSEEL